LHMTSQYEQAYLLFFKQLNFLHFDPQLIRGRDREMMKRDIVERSERLCFGMIADSIIPLVYCHNT
jgi:hypothetical protein